MSTVFDPFALGVAMLDVMTGDLGGEGVLAARQQARLARLLTVALQHSPVYRSRLRGVRSESAILAALPAISKRELMAHFDGWVTDPALQLPALQAFTADPKRIGEPYLGKYLVWESSGSTHEPGIFVQDSRALAVYDALEALRRHTPRAVWSPMTERMGFIGATSGHFASTVTMRRLQSLNPLMAQSSRCFSILQSPKTLLAELNAFAPSVIATYPSVAAMLADESQRGALTFRPKEIWTGGETLTLGVRRRLEQVLGCVVRNNYGASEFMAMAWQCRLGHLHVNSDWVILEPVDEQGCPTPAGQTSYTTLLTNLANLVQPLIRYDLGDQLLWHAEPCACGSVLPVIEVQGRRDDVLLMAGRSGQLVTLLPLALTTVMEDDAGVFDFQLCQRDARSLLLTLNVSPADAPPVVARCRQVLAAFAKQQGLLPIAIEVALNTDLPRGRSGKGKRVQAQAGSGN